MKPWYKCSEAWAAIIPAVFGILTTTGLLTPEKSTELSKNILAIVGALLTIIPTVAYSNHRTQLKKSVVEAIGTTTDNSPTTGAAAAVASVTENKVLIHLKAAGI